MQGVRGRLVATVTSAVLVLVSVGVTSPASAADSWTLTGRVTGPTTIVPGGTTTVRATYLEPDGSAVPSSTVTLQKLVDGAWVDAAPISVHDGSGTRVIYPKGDTTYRLRSGNGAVVSRTFAVAQLDVPARFTLHGSGYGHGVGMAQYGAYAQARAGRSAAQILAHYYQGTSSGTRSTPANTSVQVFGPDPYSFSGYGDYRHSTTIRVPSGDWRLRRALNGTTTTVASGSKAVTLTVSTDGSTTRAKVGTGQTYSGSIFYVQWSGTTYYRPSSTKRPVVTVAGAQGSYRHGRLVVRSARGYVNVVNDLRLNTEYLYGIAEMPSSWGISGRSALSAQAITARSYALTKSWNTRCACRVVDDVRDQQYVGWKKESEGTNAYYGRLWKSAVNATRTSVTRARVLAYDGRAVAAHYFSSSGGRTENSENVWSSRVPYERSVADQWSLDAPGNSMASWTRTITQTAARQLFGLPNVKTLRVSLRYDGGTVARLTATTAAGTSRSISGKADALRAQIGRATTAGSMPAAWIKRITVG